jgi:hypothetical protein
MKTCLLHFLGQRPPKPVHESDWDKAQRIGREVCAKIPALIDAKQGVWTELMREPILPVSWIAATRLQTALTELGIKSELTNNLEIVLRARTAQLRRIAKVERAKYDAGFLEMMRSR